MSTEPNIYTNLVVEKIRALDKGVSSQKMDGLLDAMLQLVHDKKIDFSVINKNVVCVGSSGKAICEIPLQLAKPKFRTLCARLAVRCSKWCGRKVSPYGDEVEFVHPNSNRCYRVHFENVPGCQKIAIEGLSASRRAGSSIAANQSAAAN